MSFFNRLTDIITCNLSQLLEREADPEAALEEMIREMERGVESAHRTLKTAADQENRVREQLEEQVRLVDKWDKRARQALTDGNENHARDALARKQEHLALVKGLEPEHQSALRTLDDRQTTLRALEARLADAQRKQAQLRSGEIEEPDSSPAESHEPVVMQDSRAEQIEAELEALKRELGQGS